MFAGNENYDSHQSCGNINPKNISPPQASDYIHFTAGVVSALKDANIPMAAPLKAWDWHAGGWNDKLIMAKTPAGSPLYNGFVMHPCVPMLTPQTLDRALPPNQFYNAFWLDGCANELSDAMRLRHSCLLHTAVGTLMLMLHSRRPQQLRFCKRAA